MEERLKIIIGPKGPLKTIKFEYIGNARSIGYKISGTKSLIYAEHSSKPLNLTMKFFVIQIFHKAGDPVTLNLTIRTSNNTDSIFSLSTSPKLSKASSSQNFIPVKLPLIPPDEWVNICIDLEYIVFKYLPEVAFSSLTNFEVCPTCIIINVFALTFPLKPENSGNDLPNKTKIISLKSQTVLIAENAPKSKVRNPGKSQGSTTKPPKPLLKPKRPKTFIDNTQDKTPVTFEDDFINTQELNGQDDDDTDDDDDAFTGTQPHITRDDINVHNGLPENEEEELELVFIEALNCYYCPNNQQYYQIDDE